MTPGFTVTQSAACVAPFDAGLTSLELRRSEDGVDDDDHDEDEQGPEELQGQEHLFIFE